MPKLAHNTISSCTRDSPEAGEEGGRGGHGGSVWVVRSSAVQNYERIRVIVAKHSLRSICGLRKPGKGGKREEGVDKRADHPLLPPTFSLSLLSFAPVALTLPSPRSP